MSPASKSSLAFKPLHIMLAVTIGLAIVAAGVGLTWKVANRVLIDDAREQALHWVQYIEGNLTDLDGVIAGNAIGAEDERILSLARHAGNVFRYLIFDPAGRIMFSSDFLDQGKNYEELAGYENKQLAAALFSGDLVVELEDGRSKQDRPDDYAEAYAPLFDGDRMRGVIEVYIDQTEKVARYWNDIGALLIGFAVLLALAAVLPGAFIRAQYERLRSAEAHIFELAYRDTLTGLPNRRMFKEELEQTLNQAVRCGDTSALLLLDLDHFKAVNDTLGHSAGDDLLRKVTSQIGALLSDGDLLARLGGDEFAIIYRSNRCPAAIDGLARRIVDSFDEPIETSEGAAHIGVSIGIAMLPEHGSELNIVLKNADIALYRAKDAGRGTYCYFDTTMHQQVLARQANETELRTAIATDQLEIYLQPTFDVQHKRLSATEALLRWRHPNHGLIAAGEFLPQLPESDLLVCLSNQALRKSFAAVAQLRKRGYKSLTIAVNLTGVQLRNPAFVDQLCVMLSDFAIPISNVALEVTEAVVMGQHAERVAKALGRLHSMGFKLALDDFGTGFASLLHLKRLPIDQVKIDRAFIRGIGHSAEDAAIIRSIVALAKSLDIEVVAEGVETLEQLEFLRLQGCPIAQGFGLMPPMPLDDLCTMLDNWEGGDSCEFILENEAHLDACEMSTV